MINDENTTTITLTYFVYYPPIEQKQQIDGKQSAKRDRENIMNERRAKVGQSKDDDLNDLFDQMCSLEDDTYINHLISEHLEEELEKNTREYLQYEQQQQLLEWEQHSQEQ